MGLFNFLAVGSSLKGLVSRRAHRSIPLETEVPNFSLQPGVAERLREDLDHRGDPFSRRDNVPESIARERLQKHKGPRVRSTYKPQTPAENGVAPKPEQPVAGWLPVRGLTRSNLGPEVGPPSRPVEEPRAGGADSLWVRKLKIARRVVARPQTTGGRRQPKQPSVIRGANGARKHRSPRGVAGEM